MPANPAALFRRLHRLVTPPAAPDADAVLLDRFVYGGDEDAFAHRARDRNQLGVGRCGGNEMVFVEPLEVVVAHTAGQRRHVVDIRLRDHGGHGRIDVARGELVQKDTADPREPNVLYVAWRGDHEGRALRWWIEQLRQERLAQRLVDGIDTFA